MTGQSWNVDLMVKVARRLRSWGWTVLEMPGWQTRGRPDAELRATHIIPHHTAAAVDVDRILRDGRSGLPGPLCNFAVHRNEDIVLVAAGKANHAGVATVPNQKGWGIESTGPVPVSARGKSAFPNYRAQLALCVAIRLEEGWGVDRIRAHKEIAVPDGRKPDPAFGSVYPAPYADMNRFRAEAKVSIVKRNETTEEPDVPLTLTDADTVWRNPIAIPAQFQKEYGKKAYTSEELLFSAQYHAQESHQKVAGLVAAIAASAAREAALITAVTNLSKIVAGPGGTGFTREEMQAMLDAAVAKAAADTPPAPAPADSV